jgi:hypothetical protein
MASRIQTSDAKIDVVGLRIPKFKAGTELAAKVNSIYIDTNGDSRDGADYNYSVKFTITTTIEDVTP